MRKIVNCFMLLAAGQLFAEEPGEIAEDFVLRNRATGEDLSLYNYEGHIVVLDFFAYWCGPCQTSSPKLETEIVQHYEEAKGNPAGIPVVVIGVNIELRNPGSTDQFVTNSGMSLVGDDNTGDAWRRYSKGYIPHFAVINGVAGANYKQWEVLHSNYGFSGSSFYRNFIDAVKYSDVELGSYEDWIERNQLQANDSAPNLDPDLDGRSNLLEYASGSNPLEPNPASACHCVNNGDGTVSLFYTNSNDAIGIKDRIEYSFDMITWQEYPEANGTKMIYQESELTHTEFVIQHPGPDPIFLRRTVQEIE